MTHACFDPRELVAHYPRGARELRGPFHHFGPAETVAWFAAEGVALKTEDDGRMFPVTDDSATIVDALTGAAGRAGVEVRTRAAVSALRRDGEGFSACELADGQVLPAGAGGPGHRRPHLRPGRPRRLRPGGGPGPHHRRTDPLALHLQVPGPVAGGPGRVRPGSS